MGPAIQGLKPLVGSLFEILFAPTSNTIYIARYIYLFLKLPNTLCLLLVNKSNCCLKISSFCNIKHTVIITNIKGVKSFL